MKIFITGATDGIGKQTALELAQLGHHLFIHGRKSNRLEETREWILAQVPNTNIELYLADFASLSDVQSMANTYRSKHESLDVLVNNAGVFEKKYSLTKDGFERTFAINHLAHFYLTLQFLPLLKVSSSARIINVASRAQASHIDFDNLNAEKGYDPYKAYELSKLCNILFTAKLARELSQTSISTNALHPGVIDTKILHAGWNIKGDALKNGAATSVYLATSLDIGKTSGLYYIDKQISRPSKAADKIENQDKLWEISLKMCNL